MEAVSTCHACRASSADGSPMICDRDDCPGEIERRSDAQLRREERAHERGEHEAREEGRQERLARMREWDIAVGKWMP